MKVNFYTISTMLYSTVKQRNTTIGFAIAMILIAIASINVFLNQRAIGARRSNATIGGKGGRSTLISLGAARPILLAFVLLFIAVAVLGPLFILCIDTLMLKPGVYSWDNLSLHYWIGAAGKIKAVYEGEPGVLATPDSGPTCGIR
jgi:iron(III) transport system permease protein